MPLAWLRPSACHLLGRSTATANGVVHYNYDTVQQQNLTGLPSTSLAVDGTRTKKPRAYIASLFILTFALFVMVG